MADTSISRDPKLNATLSLPAAPSLLTLNSSDISPLPSPDRSDQSDIEDYDTLRPDPSAVIDGGRGGGFEPSNSAITSNGTVVATNYNASDSSEESHSLGAGASAVNEKHVRMSRRQSFQVTLEKTAKRGTYILTANDAEIRQILRRGLEPPPTNLDGNGKPRKRFSDLVFTRRFTTFDRQNPASSESPFHGFFTLFWIAMALLLVKVALQNWKVHGSVLGNAELMHIMFDRDLLVLGMADGIMVGSTIFGMLLQKAIVRGYLSWETSGWVIQNIWQVTFLASVVGWTYYREWPWTHTIFFVLHGLIFLMKQHSYAFYNGYLSQVARRKQILEQKLDQLDLKEPNISSPITGASKANDATTSSGVECPVTTQSAGFRKRGYSSSNSKASTDLNAEISEIAAIAAAIDSGDILDESQMATFERVIQTEISSLHDELNGKCSNSSNKYPKNLTIMNWADYTVLPTLVYELEYPRQEKINWWYVLEKTAATFGVIWCMMVISQAYIYPSVAETMRMKEAGMTLIERCREFPFILSDMLFPLLLEQLLAWYVIWECSLNVLAEVTCFADRGFYGDWWNSVSWDQYARDWNRPVHNFLLRHVYHSSISAFHLSKGTATFVTFLLSALVHELLMLCLFKKVRGYLFCLQLMQVPLVSLSRTKLLKGRSILGNAVFWFGLFVGPSLLTSLYLIV